MFRLLLMIALFLLSLLTICRAPASVLWYVAILVSEFCWIFFFIVFVLLLWRFGNPKFSLLSSLIGIASLILFSVPIVGAYRLSSPLRSTFRQPISSSIASAPFSFWQMIGGINANQVAYQTLTYDAAKSLTLDFYPSTIKGNKPCVIVVHGGSWAGGDSRQLPELNSELAKQGYHVASINYRLAPQYIYPSPVQDVRAAIAYLKSNSVKLFIDTNNFVLLGRSAGGQIVLAAAYSSNDVSIKGVISFYGPADMVWGYANPTNPLVLNSRKIMEDYLGGTYPQVPIQYVNSSATETATKHAPPTLLIHGENDPLVSHLHGFRLDKKLDSLGVKHYDLYMPWATHGFDWTLNGPGGQLSTWCVKRFLGEVIASKDEK